MKLPDDTRFYINLIGNIPSLVFQVHGSKINFVPDESYRKLAVPDKINVPSRFKPALIELMERQLWQYDTIALWLRFKLLNEVLIEPLLKDPNTDRHLFEHARIPYYQATLNLCQGLWIHEPSGVFKVFFQSPAHMWFRYFYSFYQLWLTEQAKNCEAAASPEYDKETVTLPYGKVKACEKVRKFIDDIDIPTDKLIPANKLKTETFTWEEIDAQIQNGLLPELIYNASFSLAADEEDFEKTYHKPYIRALSKDNTFTRKNESVYMASVDTTGEISYGTKWKQVSKQRKRRNAKNR